MRREISAGHHEAFRQLARDFVDKEVASHHRRLERPALQKAKPMADYNAVTPSGFEMPSTAS